MALFKHTLHRSPLHGSPIEPELTRNLAARAGERMQAALLIPRAVPVSGMQIPLTTVTWNPATQSMGGFDATIAVGFDGAPAGQTVPLLLDSGNNVLIVPDYAAIPGPPAYQTLTATPVTEPWNCPAHIVQGPINIATRAHGVLRIPDCIFYACTADNPDGKSGRTSNFGFGYTTAWTVDSGHTLKPALVNLPGLPFVEVDIRPATGSAAAPVITEDSSLTLSAAAPGGYSMFSLANSTTWMSLVPKALSVAGTQTAWPGALNPIIAMIDTGGGTAFLSDPAGALTGTAWPDTVDSPFAAENGYDQGIATTADIQFTLGDDGASTYTYTLSSSVLPPAAEGPLLVMCTACEYMFGANGMNIGGVSMLTNLVLIDYAGGRLGLKPK